MATVGFCCWIKRSSEGGIAHRERDALGDEKYRKLYPDAPLPHITPHVFRHTFCTNMANAGMDIKALQYVMGHSDASITLNVYAHASYDHAAEQMAKLVAFPGSSDRQERKMSG